MSAQKLGWKQLTRGGMVVQPGSAREFLTGDWKTKKPVLQESKCTNCLFCWIWCPEPAIHRGAKTISFDYNYCKGCGICAVECPVKAITMVEEH
jgi:pyruvate ferredoxin oxidoreductase delta subunit